MTVVDLGTVRSRRADERRVADQQQATIKTVVVWVTQTALTAAEQAFRVAGHLTGDDAEAARDVYQGARRRLLARVRYAFRTTHPDVNRAMHDLAATTYRGRLLDLTAPTAKPPQLHGGRP